MDLRINKAIRADKVRVISEEGKQIGVMSVREALSIAEGKNLDLIEISPQAKPPVCKIMDFGKYRYMQAKKEKESKKSQVQIKVKEIKLKPNIDKHDLETKINKAKKFLDKGMKVRVTCTFRGREMLHTEIGESLIQKVFDEVQEIASIEAPVKKMGKIMTVVFAPLGKKAKTMKKKETTSAKDENK